MLGQFRSFFKPFFGLLATPFIWLKINPNLVSLFALPFAGYAAFAYSTGQYAPALIGLLLASVWDGVDGTVARVQGKQTLWGNYFETMIDKLVEILLFLGLAIMHPLAGVAALGFSLWSSYAKPRVALVIITDNRDWPAIGEHADKLVLLFLATLLSVVFPSFSFQIIEYGLWAIAFVSFIGTLQRMGYARNLIRIAEKEGTVLPYLKAGKER
ncbi:MAG: CDP-alcohol phosphatidyltransferase family protein [Candidatus Diapherotrites archaeon]